jgi:hypothetical protein
MGLLCHDEDGEGILVKDDEVWEFCSHVFQHRLHKKKLVSVLFLAVCLLRTVTIEGHISPHS